MNLFPFNFIKNIFNSSSEKLIKQLYLEVDKITKMEKDIAELSDINIKQESQLLKETLNDQPLTDDIKHKAFALVRESAKRVINQRHYDVQIIGGLILHSGKIAEMRTGEGKTLVATLPAYLNALLGKKVHIVTVNDYLARRDAAWMGKIFEFLGLTCSCVVNTMNDQERKDAYASDIVYVTNNELGFDFLRDNMKYSKQDKVLQSLDFAIIDEVDSILIDEARTPLIISGSTDLNIQIYQIIDNLIRMLSPTDYTKEEKEKNAYLTDEGINKMESLMIQNKIIKSGSSLYDIENIHLIHYISQALKAHFIFTRDADYIVKTGKIFIIDEFTGRIMEGRRYSDGLHQAIEAKEKVKIQNENQTLASITFQNYFRMYEKLSGMTGTAASEEKEFQEIYGLSVVQVPTHRTLIRKDLDDMVYGTKQEKYDAILSLVKNLHEKGQPILIGTINIDKSEEISNLLKKNKIPHNVLNAKFHEKEAHIIAQAGRHKAVTIATNMAGRGTDIILGGNPEMLLSDLASMSLTHDQLNEKQQEIIDTLNNEKTKVIELGGLCVIGTERHDSRRIDDQLRGRSGRQGDPGMTRFFLSLEDDLMRIFGLSNMSNMLKKLGLKNGEHIQHPMVTNSLAKAQKKVEMNNYDVRKNLLKFDDVINEQRNIIYNQRNLIMNGVHENKFIENSEYLVEEIVDRYISKHEHREEWEIHDLLKEIQNLFNIHIEDKEIANISGAENEIKIIILNKVKQLYQNKINDFGVEIMKDILQKILLSTLDHAWKEHLHKLDHLRQGISLRAYAQKNPLNEYKSEAFEYFEDMLAKIKYDFIQKVSHVHIDIKPQTDIQENTNEISESLKSHEESLQPNKVSRNQMCFCGSKKKYKHCHGKLDLDNKLDDKIVSRNQICFCGSNKRYKHCHGKLVE